MSERRTWTAPCVGVLLAGGAARRFEGQPKGLARIGGERIADLGLRALEAATDSQLVVSNDPRAPEWFPAVSIVTDAVPGLGPLAGLETALRVARGAAVLVVAWDMPFVTSSLLQMLRTAGERHSTSAVPTHGEPLIVESLCAYYSPEALTVCSRLLASGERRAHALFASLPAAIALDANALVGESGPGHLFAGVDDATQLLRFGGSPPPAY